MSRAPLLDLPAGQALPTGSRWSAPPRDRLPLHLRLLLRTLAAPDSHRLLDESDWDRLLRAARAARLLGTLAARVQRCVDPQRLPELVRRHFAAALTEARFRRHALLHLVGEVSPTVLAHAPVCIALKGAAYVLQGAEAAEGRLPADVDLLVPRASLAGVEAALLASGWEFEKTETYDQRYYRDWSHELPPMQCAGQALELDLHHAILPPLGRLRPRTELLLDAAVQIAGSPLRALQPMDQLLHVAAHLFQDSDCTNRLRDLVDFDALLRPLAERHGHAGLATALAGRAAELQLTRPLGYAAAFADVWCASPAAPEIRRALGATRAGRPSAAVGNLAAVTLGPPDPDSLPASSRQWASRLLALRAVWLRFPPWLLAYHGASKLWRALRRGRVASKAQGGP